MSDRRLPVGSEVEVGAGSSPYLGILVSYGNDHDGDYALVRGADGLSHRFHPNLLHPVLRLVIGGRP